MRIKMLTKSLIPYVKKLSPNEISDIKCGLLQQQKHPSLQQVGVADQAYVPTESSDHPDCQTKADHQDTAKKRPSLSLKRRSKKQDSTNDLQKQISPSKKRKFSSVKKPDLSISRNQQDFVTPSQYCSVDMESTVSSPFDEPSALRYHPLHFVAATEDNCTSKSSPHHHENDNSDALLNMGYLSPMTSSQVDCDCKTSLLVSPFKSSSPAPSSSSDSSLNTSFSLVLPGSSSSTSEHSTSSSTDGSSCSSSCSHSSFENVLIDDIIVGDPQMEYKQVVTTAESYDPQQEPLLTGSCDQVVDTPLNGSDNDTLSYISESPQSKLPCSKIPLNMEDNICIITPASAPPTSSHLLDTLDQYGIPHVIHEQPFCSNPHDVPPTK